MSGGVRLVGETSEALERIVARVTAMEELLPDVAGSAKEQTTALGEVGVAISQMDHVTHQNAERPNARPPPPAARAPT